MKTVPGKGKNLMYDGNVCEKGEHACNGGRKKTVFEEVWNKKAEVFQRKESAFEMDPKLHRKLKGLCESCNGIPLYCWQ